MQCQIYDGMQTNGNQLSCSNIQTNVELRFSPLIARRKRSAHFSDRLCIFQFMSFAKISQINYLVLVQLDVSHRVRPYCIYEYALYMWSIYEYPYG